MKFFINQNNDVLIPIFSKYHFIIILLTFLFVTLVILNKDKNMALKIIQAMAPHNILQH